MTHSFKNTLIMMFSIILMLISNYVSSSPAMAMNSVTVQSVSGPESTHSHHTTHTSCMSMSESKISHSMQDDLQPDTNHSVHCGDTDSSLHTCCASVCSSVSYPSQVPQPLSAFASSLAPHQSIKIGDTVARLQSILRPPTV